MNAKIKTCWLHQALSSVNSHGTARNSKIDCLKWQVYKGSSSKVGEKIEILERRCVRGSLRNEKGI